MGTVLRVVATIYLIVIWMGVAFILANSRDIPPNAYLNSRTLQIYALFFGASASLPAKALYAFGQIVSDTRAIRGHLSKMVRLLEPHGQI